MLDPGVAGGPALLLAFGTFGDGAPPGIESKKESMVSANLARFLSGLLGPALASAEPRFFFCDNQASKRLLFNFSFCSFMSGGQNKEVPRVDILQVRHPDLMR